MDSVIGEEAGRGQTSSFFGKIEILEARYYTCLGHVLQKGQQVLSRETETVEHVIPRTKRLIVISGSVTLLLSIALRAVMMQDAPSTVQWTVEIHKAFVDLKAASFSTQALGCWTTHSCSTCM